MLCRNPFMADNMAYGCGQCIQCRINRKRHWANRLVLESMSHEFNCFVTLTYDDDHLPHACGCKRCSGNHPGGTLRPDDVTKWLKRVRFGLPDRIIRYYYCGEYGDNTHRPHYHVMLFGVATIEEPYLQSKWPHGHLYIGECNAHTAGYVAGYVTKKMTSHEDERLEGRHPEYARMSLRPGIGGLAADSLGDTLMTKEGSYAVIQSEGDAPNEIRLGGRLQPLHKYIKARIRARVGLPKPGIESKASREARKRLQDLLGVKALSPAMEKKAALINKTEHLARARIKRQQIWASAQRRKTL